MVQIHENGKAMGSPYRFSTRREAFTTLLQLERERPASTFTIHLIPKKGVV